MNVESVVVRFGADASQFFGVFDAVESRMLALGTDILFKVARSTAMLGAEWEAMATNFTTMIGSAEKGYKVLSDIRELAIKSPFTTMGLVKGGEMLLGFGTEAENLIPILSRLGDAAGGNQSKLMRLALAFGQVQAAGRFMGTELRQFTEAGIGAKDFAETYGTSTGQFVRDMKAGKIGVEVMIDTVNRLTSQGGRFFGRSDNLLTKVMGQWNSLTETIQKIQMDIGVKLFEKLGVAGGLEALTKNIEGLATKVDPLIDWVGRAVPIVQELYDFGKADFMAGKDMISSLLGEPVTLETVRDTLRDVLDFMLEGMVNVLVTAQDVGNFIDDNWITPITNVYKAGMQVVGVFELLYNWVGSVLDKLGLLGDAMRMVVSIIPPFTFIRGGAADKAFGIHGDSSLGSLNQADIVKSLGKRNPLLGIGLGYILGGKTSADPLALGQSTQTVAASNKFFEQWDKRGMFRNSGFGMMIQAAEDAKTRFAKERERTDFFNSWNKLGMGTMWGLINHFLTGGKGGPRQIPTAPRWSPDMEKFSTGIQKDLENRHPLQVFLRDMEKINTATRSLGPAGATIPGLGVIGRGALGPNFALDPLLNKQEAEFGMFSTFQKLKKIIGDSSGESKLPHAVRKGTVEAQEIINRSQRPELTAQQEVLRVMTESRIILDAIKDYQSQIIPELQKWAPEFQKMAKALEGGEEV